MPPLKNNVDQKLSMRREVSICTEGRKMVEGKKEAKVRQGHKLDHWRSENRAQMAWLYTF